MGRDEGDANDNNDKDLKKQCGLSLCFLQIESSFAIDDERRCSLINVAEPQHIES